MRLFGDPRAPNVRRVRIFAAEKGLEIPFERVDLAAGEHRSPSYLAMNPAGEVPALELADGEALAESVAICRYLEALHPRPPLFGEGALEAARVEMWHRRVELKVSLPVQYAARNGNPAFEGGGHGTGGAQSQDFADYGRRVAEESCDWLDRELGGRSFVAGDGFTIADIALLAAIDFARVAKLRLWEGRPALDRWYRGVSARPSAEL